MGLLFVLWIWTCLAIQAQVAWAKIQIKPAHKHILTGSNSPFLWSRDSYDPNEFVVGKRMHGNNSLPTMTLQPVHAGNKTHGIIQFSFETKGKFHVLALDHNSLNDHKIFQHNYTEIDLNKLPKASLLKEITVDAEAGNSSSYSSSSSAGMATTSSQTSQSALESSNSNSHGHSSSTAVIIAACLGTTLLAVIGLFIAYFILRRRRRKFATTYLDSRYAFTDSAAPSPAPSRARLLQKLRNTSGDTPPSIDMTRKGTDEDTSWPDTLNFYHTPRPPPKAVVKRPSHNTGSSTVVSSGTDTSLSSMRFSPKTERQMEIEERIEELKGKLPFLQQSTPTSVGRPDSRTLTDMTHHVRVLKWRNQIDKLQELMTSEWALGRTDIVPKGLYGHQSIV